MLLPTWLQALTSPMDFHPFKLSQTKFFFPELVVKYSATAMREETDTFSTSLGFVSQELCSLGLSLSEIY